jgi:hypothetical protein
MKAPNLSHLGILHVAWGSPNIESLIEESLILFPDVQNMSLHGFRISQNSFLGMIAAHFVERWTLRGIKLDVR